MKCPNDLQPIFIRNKTDVVRLRAGSGNTASIGFIKRRHPEEFSTTSGPFARFRFVKEVCDFYWQNYENLVREINDDFSQWSHPLFQRFF
ncbi:hypothetical protein BBB56_08260 [Candidatus Pantoea deserta]|uniref:Uncharacterized protein n=1 Tax=Candidatus Pantoea deserta TaxID=1869313 RepID=A0A3N4P2B4_9GAMM|nr:hypothetical protein BBB56_08260 [Pantoea deserta]